MARQLELGLDTSGDVTVGADGRPLHEARVIRDLVDEAVLADQVGVDFIGVGEHHRADLTVSSPEVVLGRGSFTESFPLFGYELNQYAASAAELIIMSGQQS